jgi:hypothetical protein
MKYRFLRLEWRAVENMSKELNDALASGESVVSISTTDDEVLVLIQMPNTI